MVRELTDIMFPESVSEDRLNYFVNDILLDDGTLTPEMWFEEWSDFIILALEMEWSLRLFLCLML